MGQECLLSRTKQEMKPVGILSEKDLLVAYDFLGETETKIEDFISGDIAGVEESTEIKDISRLLVQKNFKRVPVIKDKKAIGIVSRSDIIDWILSQRTS